MGALVRCIVKNKNLNIICVLFEDVSGLQVFDIGKGTQTPITGLEFHRIGHSSKYVIFVTTPKRLYQFMGHSGSDERPLLQPIFNSYLNVPETGFQEIPSSLTYSRLQFYHSPTSATNTPTLFAWLTEPGIFHGQVYKALFFLFAIPDVV